MILVASVLIVLHNIDGGEIVINPKHVVQLYQRREGTSGVMTKGVNCTIGLSDGKIVSVIETCPAVRRMIEDAK